MDVNKMMEYAKQLRSITGNGVAIEVKIWAYNSGAGDRVYYRLWAASEDRHYNFDTEEDMIRYIERRINVYNPDSSNNTNGNSGGDVDG